MVQGLKLIIQVFDYRFIIHFTLTKFKYLGTTVLYKPGIITGGKIYHECDTSRAIGYFLEPLVVLAPFGKQIFDLTLTGITNDNIDISVCVKENIMNLLI